MAAYEGESYTVDEYKKLNTATGKEFSKAGEEVVGKQAQDWRNQGSPVPGTNAPEDIRSLGSQLIDFATTPAGNATLGGLGLLALGARAGVGLKGRRSGGGEQGPRVEPTFNDIPPTPPAGGPKPNFPQGDVTDVASRPVGQPRAQLGGSAGGMTTPPAAPAPMAPAPTAPSPVAGGAPAPANVAPAPVAPVDPLVQAKLDAIADKQRRENEAHAAQQRRLDEAHQSKLANEAKRNETVLQKNQGKTASTTSVDAQATQLLVKSEENKLSKAVASATAPKPVPPPTVSPTTGLPVTPAASVIAPPDTPITPTTPAPSGTTVAVEATQAPVEPPKKAPKAKTPMPEGWGKGMTWLVNQHGVEGAQDFIDRYNNGKPFTSHDLMEARRQEVTMRPKFSDIPKSVRKERGITAAVVPPSQPSGGMAVSPRTGGGGRLNETGRPGEEIIHNLNPLKL